MESYTKRDDRLQRLVESEEELLFRTCCTVLGGSPCLISTPERVTFGFSASEPAESLLGPVLRGGTVNPHRLASTCKSGIAHGCVLTLSPSIFLVT